MFVCVWMSGCTADVAVGENADMGVSMADGSTQLDLGSDAQDLGVTTDLGVEDMTSPPDMSCAALTHRCGSTCESNSSVASCGTTACTPCVAPANATSTCDGTACGFACSEGYYLDGGACVACSTCDTGEVQAAACTGSTDTVCTALRTVGGSAINLRIGRTVTVAITSVAGSLYESKNVVGIGEGVPFTFDAAVLEGNDYAVTIVAQPQGASCAVTGGSDSDGSGVASSANVTDITITCTDKPARLYMINEFSTDITMCSVASDGDVSGCSTVTAGDITGVGFAIHNGFAYIVGESHGGSAYLLCTLNATTGAVESCLNSTPSGVGGNARRITFYGGRAYIINQEGDPSTYTLCDVSESTGVLSNCVTSGVSPDAMTSSGSITFYGGYAYATNFYGDANNFLRCSVSVTDGTLSDCNRTTPSPSGALLFPYQIGSIGEHMYITNAGGPNYTRCAIDDDRQLVDCTTVTPSSPGALDSPRGLGFVNDHAYFGSNGTAFTTCKVGLRGSELTDCNTVAVPGLNNVTQMAVVQ